MTCDEKLNLLEEAGRRLVQAYKEQGCVAVVVFTRDDGEHFSMWCPQSFVVRPILLKAADYLQAQESGHRC